MMANPVLMPKLGLTMTEGIVDEWYVEAGASIAAGDALCSISSEKLSQDVTADTAGELLKIVVAAEESTKVKEPIAWIGAAGESLDHAAGNGAADGTADGTADDAKDATAPAATDAAPRDGQRDAQPSHKPSAEGKERIFISRLALKIAQKYDIDYTQITGTGGRGRITKRDVEAYRAQLAEAQAAQPTADATTPPDTAAAQPGMPPAAVGAGLTGMRKIIAQNMMHSLHSTAQLTLQRSVDVTELIAVTKQLRAQIQDAAASKALSLNIILLKAVANALQEYPALNARYDGETLEQLTEVNVGIAVALPNGLAVPTIGDVAGQSLSQLRRTFVDRVERARQGDIDTSAPGTFTITNLGAEGIEYFTPVLNVPEVAILGVGALQQQLQLDDAGAVVARTCLPLSLTIDHQIIDGQEGAHFLGQLAAILQDPYSVIL